MNYPAGTIIEISEDTDISTLQQQYSNLIAKHVAVLQQHGLPRDAYGASALLDSLDGELFARAAPCFEVLEATLVTLDLITVQHTKPHDAATLKSTDLDHIFCKEFKFFNAASYLLECPISADDVDYCSTKARVRMQLDAVYLALNIDRNDVLRQGIEARKGRELPEPRLNALKKTLQDMPAPAVANAHRKAVADDVNCNITTLERCPDKAMRAQMLRSVIEHALNFCAGQIVKVLEMLEFTFITVCKVLGIHVAPLTNETIENLGFDNLMGEWFKMDPVPDIIAHVRNALGKPKECPLGALSQMRIMLDAGRYLAGIPHSIQLQLGIAVHSKHQSKEELKTVTIH